MAVTASPTPDVPETASPVRRDADGPGRIAVLPGGRVRSDLLVEAVEDGGGAVIDVADAEAIV